MASTSAQAVCAGSDTMKLRVSPRQAMLRVTRGSMARSRGPGGGASAPDGINMAAPGPARPAPSARCHWRSGPSLIPSASLIGQRAEPRGGGSRETTTINRAGRARAHGGHARPATAPAEAPARAGEGWGSLGGGSQSTANHLPIRANQTRPARPRPTEAEAARQRALRRRVLAPRARIGRVRRGGKGANGGARSGAGLRRERG